MRATLPYFAAPMLGLCLTACPEPAHQSDTDDGTRVVVEPGCGNGVVEAAEQCDDGNGSYVDGCTPDCVKTAGTEGFDAVLQEVFDKHSIPGAAVAVTRNGKLEILRAYGEADPSTGRAMHADDRVRIASLSKPITAAVILKLAERGDLSLDDPMIDHLGELAPGQGADPRLASITIRNLLHHSGGWDRDLSGDPMFKNRQIAEAMEVPAPAEAQDVMRWMWTQKLDHDPGTTFAYSNFGYCVLGRIIEQVTGQTYEAATQDLLLHPAGAMRMQIGRTLPDERPDDEVAYVATHGETRSVFDDSQVPWPDGGFYLEHMDSHGGWIASAPDLLHFVLAIDGQPSVPDALSAASLRELQARPDLAIWEDSASWYGLGWSVRPAGSSANWWHTGSLPGSMSLMVRSHNGYTWAVVVNQRPGDSGAFMGDLDQGVWSAIAEVEKWPGRDLFTGR